MHEYLDDLLRQLDPLPLECDGLTRVLSTLLCEAEIEHMVYVGGLEVATVGSIPLHFWVALPSGEVVDLRARMWLGSDDAVPHGVFRPRSNQRYILRSAIHPAPLSPTIFQILAGAPMADFALPKK